MMEADKEWLPAPDPEDPNYMPDFDYEKFHELVHNLPEGWSRRTDCPPGAAPFVHVSGEESWKNPNSKLMAQMGKEAMKRKQSFEDDERDSFAAKRGRSTVKRLKLMLKAGAPLGAVKQRAALEGIDMSLILDDALPELDGGAGAPPVPAEASSDPQGKQSDKANSAIPPILIQKYKRMLKAGVPMPRVQEMALRETKANSWETIADQMAITTNECPGKSAFGEAPAVETEPNKPKETANQVGSRPVKPPLANLQSGKMAKYKRMLQAGIPVAAIYQQANLVGISSSALSAELGVPPPSNKEPSQQPPKEKAPTENTIAESTQNEAKPIFFTPIGKEALSIPSDSTLASLVRQMAQTVQKSGRATNAMKTSNMQVDIPTLYNALGSIQGVQFARDEYNSTCSTSSPPNMSEYNKNEWVKAKRQSFIEMAQTIGLSIPSTPDAFNTPVEVDGLDDLVSFIESRYHTELHRVQAQFNDDSLYDFDSLGWIYRPGSRVVAKNAGGGGVDMMCQVIWNRYREGKTIMGKVSKYFQVCLRYIVAVGGGGNESARATLAEVIEGVENFDGKRSLFGDSLTFIPLDAFPALDREALLDRYSDRGHMYNHVALSDRKPYSYMEYSKGNFIMKQSGRAGGGPAGSGANASTALATGGRIIVDVGGASDYGHSLSVGYDPMITGIQYKMKEHKLLLRTMEQKKEAPNAINGSGASSSRGSMSGMVLFDKVPNEYLGMVWPVVIGFSLSAKSWGEVYVDGLNEITFQPDIFDRLVLPESRKKMVKALAKHTSGSTESGFQDLVQGKGEGSVFLLYGPPGVGKTLTAEAVAEVLRRPLYNISMGTLGTTAAGLERSLGEILQLSAKWDAIILLDEADSFLETRSSHSSSIERNAMVCVMLKLVEYFTGILFLTSNRIDSLDPAFQTRITLALRYDSLDVEGRARVWKNLLAKSGYQKSLDAGIIDVGNLAKFVLNGREIKNALRLAMALSADQQSPLSQSILEETVSIVNDYKVSPAVGDKSKKRSRRWFPFQLKRLGTQGYE